MITWVDLDYDNPETYPPADGEYFCEVVIGSIKTSIIKRAVKFERGRFIGLGDSWAYVKRWLKETEEPVFKKEDLILAYDNGQLNNQNFTDPFNDYKYDEEGGMQDKKDWLKENYGIDI